MPARPNLNQLKTPGITGVRMSLHTEFTSCHPTNSVKALKEEQGKYRQRWRKKPTNQPWDMRFESCRRRRRIYVRTGATPAAEPRYR